MILLVARRRAEWRACGGACTTGSSGFRRFSCPTLILVNDKHMLLGCEEQCAEIWGLADNPARGVHAIDLCSQSEPSETSVQAVLNAPGSTLVIELETVATPGMTDEIMDRTKAIKRATELTVE